MNRVILNFAFVILLSSFVLSRDYHRGDSISFEEYRAYLRNGVQEIIEEEGLQFLLCKST